MKKKRESGRILGLGILMVVSLSLAASVRANEGTRNVTDAGAAEVRRPARGAARLTDIAALPVYDAGARIGYVGSIDPNGDNADWDWGEVQDENGEWILFDGRTTVEAPVGTFFGCEQPFHAAKRELALLTFDTSDPAVARLSNRFPMPFFKSAAVRLENRGATPVCLRSAVVRTNGALRYDPSVCRVRFSGEGESFLEPGAAADRRRLSVPPVPALRPRARELQRASRKFDVRTVLWLCPAPLSRGTACLF